jgi:hypothetical protein
MDTRLQFQDLINRARQAAERAASSAMPYFRVKVVTTPDGVRLGFINAARNLPSLAIYFGYFLAYLASGGTLPSSDAEREFIEFLKEQNIPVLVEGDESTELPEAYASHRGGQLKWLLNEVGSDTISGDAVAELAVRLARAYLSS